MPDNAADQEDGAWFAAKTYGYGAGLPIAWQGWALTGGFIGLASLAGLGLHGLARIVAVLGLSAVFVTIALLKTRGGPRWRWGRD